MQKETSSHLCITPAAESLMTDRRRKKEKMSNSYSSYLIVPNVLLSILENEDDFNVRL